MTNQTPLEQAVLQSIKSGGVCPRTRWWYICTNYLIWGSWVVAILLGGIAVSVLIFTGLHGWYGFYELVGMSLFGYLLLRITFVWPIVLIVATVLAYLNFRCTRRGYRYPVWLVLSSIVAASMLLGLVLHTVGAGYITDRLLAQYVPMYPAQDKIVHQIWHQPAFGRIIGSVAGEPVGGVVPFVALDGTSWQIHTDSLAEEDAARLMAGETVHIVGTTTGPFVLKGCAVVKPMLFASTTFPQLVSEGAKREKYRAAMAACR